MTELLRFATAGSVDDGKSTLIGRLLFDSKQIFDDQWESVERVSRERGEGYTNLALLTDGLRAEREQGITIDVAYRYFNTPKRKFIIADTPGPRAVHAQHGDRRVHRRPGAHPGRCPPRHPGAEPPPRHPHHHAAGAARRAVRQQDGPGRLQPGGLRQHQEPSSRTSPPSSRSATCRSCPSARSNGDNVVTRSTNMPWYEGASLLHMLEDVHIASDRNLIDSRFPVQYVIRPMSDDHHDYRGFAGTVAGGVFKVGDEVMVLPSGFTTTIAAIDTFEGPIDEAFPPMSVTIRLRGRDRHQPRLDDLPCAQPAVGRPGHRRDDLLDGRRPSRIQAGDRYTIKHTTQTGRAIIKEVAYQLDVNSLHRNEHPGKLNLNELGRVTLRTTVPLFYDEYRRNRTTGSFILIDEGTNSTVGAGMILGAP